MDAQSRKTYIFFATDVVTISGAPLYYLNKKKYLESKGWTVLIFSFVKGVPGLTELNLYHKLVIPELKFFPYFYTKKKQKKIINIILGKIPFSQEIIIETSHPLSAPWAEIIAEKLQCKHFIYSLAERVNSYGIDFYKYLLFKFQRRELVGIHTHSIPSIMGKSLDDENYKVPSLSVLPTHTITNVAKIDFNKSKILPNRVNIISIGRPNKPYFLPTMKSFKNYAKDNPQILFNLIIVGDDSAILKNLKSMCMECSNVNMVTMGELFPIPEDLLACVDVCIASSGSATLAKKFGLATISIDAKDLKPIGILGYNATNSLFRSEKEPPIELSILLDCILKKKEVQSNFVLPESYGKIENYYSHFHFLEKSEPEKKYYRFSQVKSRNKLIVLGGIFIGLNNCNRIAKVIKRFKKVILK